MDEYGGDLKHGAGTNGEGGQGWPSIAADDGKITSTARTCPRLELMTLVRKRSRPRKRVSTDREAVRPKTDTMTTLSEGTGGAAMTYSSLDQIRASCTGSLGFTFESTSDSSHRLTGLYPCLSRVGMYSSGHPCRLCKFRYQNQAHRTGPAGAWTTRALYSWSNDLGGCTGGLLGAGEKPPAKIPSAVGCSQTKIRWPAKPMIPTPGRVGCTC